MKILITGKLILMIVEGLRKEKVRGDNDMTMCCWNLGRMREGKTCKKCKYLK